MAALEVLFSQQLGNGRHFIADLAIFSCTNNSGLEEGLVSFLMCGTCTSRLERLSKGLNQVYAHSCNLASNHDLPMYSVW